MFAELVLSWEKMALDIGDIVWQEPFVCPRVLRYFPRAADVLVLIITSAAPA